MRPFASGTALALLAATLGKIPSDLGRMRNRVAVSLDQDNHDRH